MIRKVYLEMTNQCNLICSSCFRRAWTSAQQALPDHLLKKITTELLRMEGLKDIVLGGIGEPLFDFRAAELIHKLRSFRLTLTTNGTVMNPEIREAIVESVDHLVVSIDGSAEWYTKMRSHPLQPVVDHLRNLRAARKKASPKSFDLSIQMVLHRGNVQDAFSVIDTAHQLGAQQVFFSHMLPIFPEDEQRLIFQRYGDTRTRAFFHTIRNYAMRRGLRARLPEYELKTERRCPFIDDHTTMINAYGDVVPCYRFAHDSSEQVFGHFKTVRKHPFGHIQEDTLSNIWGYPSYQNFRDIVRNTQYASCLDCDLADGCDLVRSTEVDCYGCAPSCGDCMWSRRAVFCV